MSIEEYLEFAKIGMTEFAKRCMLSRYCLYSIINGTRRPLPGTIFLISVGSEGYVMKKDIERYQSEKGCPKT